MAINFRFLDMSTVDFVNDPSVAQDKNTIRELDHLLDLRGDQQGRSTLTCKFL